MVISRARLDATMTADVYLAQMREQQDLFEQNCAATRLTEEERTFFRALPAPLTVLVLTEDWCGDSAANLPIVVALAAETSKLDLRILTRTGNEEIADRYRLADGRNHIPTYIVLDAHLNEIGHLIERPAAVTAQTEAFKVAWFAERPALGSADAALGELEPEVRARYLDAAREHRITLRELEQREMIAAFAELAVQAFATA